VFLYRKTRKRYLATNLRPLKRIKILHKVFKALTDDLDKSYSNNLFKFYKSISAIKKLCIKDITKLDLSMFMYRKFKVKILRSFLPQKDMMKCHSECREAK
jgi:hypothetical protein